MNGSDICDAPSVLNVLRDSIRDVLGDNLYGMYVFGSMEFGDFDPEISDIDVLAAVRTPLRDDEFCSLESMHEQLVNTFPGYHNRIEVAYVSLDALKSFKQKPGPIGIVSPGEPLHRISAGLDWQINWYFVLSHGRTLFGPAPDSFIEPVSDAEFLESVRAMAEAWTHRVATLRDARGMSYAVLTLARTLYTLTTGKHVSKASAIAWVGDEYPEWRSLLTRAMMIRAEPGHDTPDPEAVQQAIAFNAFVDQHIGE